MSWLILFLRTRQEKEGEQLVYPLTSACSSTQRSLPYRGNISARVGKEKQRQRGIKKKIKKKIQKGEKKEQRRQRRWQHSDDDTNRRSDNEDGAPGAAWKVAEAASSCFFVLFFLCRFSIGKTYLALAIVPPRPLVTQTNKTARTYHRGAVSDLGLDTAIFLKLDQVVERIPWPRAGERA